MVSFSCEACGDILTKKKLDPHRSRCRGATFTCIDCMVHFPGFEYRSHTSCMTEDQKYQGALYKAKPNKQQQKPANQRQQRQDMALQPYVEDVGEDKQYETWQSWHEYETQTGDDKSPTEPPPEAPTPPSAANDDHLNVFEFLVATGQTPNASSLNLPRDQQDMGESTSLVRYKPKSDDLPDPASLMEHEPLVQYGTGPVPTGAFVTPTSKSERRRHKDGEVKKDKKRKRLHVDLPRDQEMTDAPPVLHSGLTGGLKGLMRPTFPPSPPDYSGDNIAEASPASPLKKSKHSKHSKTAQVTSGIFGMLAGAPQKTKSKKRKTSSKKHSHHRDEKEQKLIEFRPHSKDDGANSQMVVFKPRADVFLSFVNKGPESERGCSMNKALKRFHREREAAGSSSPKVKEEKELWRSLRLRRNDRGEIVIFSI